MTNDVWVSVCGIHVTEEEQDPIRTVSQGSYFLEQGQHKICYEESGGGMSGNGTRDAVATRLTVSRPLQMQGREIRYVDLLKNSGGRRTRIRFMPGRKQALDYQTPYGPIAMEVETHKVQVEEGADALRVELQYDLAMEGRRVSTCKLVVEVTSRTP